VAFHKGYLKIKIAKKKSNQNTICYINI
jgi:hypothetical protein